MSEAEDRGFAPLVAGVAIALPFLIAHSAVPDTVFYNQLAAVFLWGGALCLMGLPPRLPISRPGRVTLFLALAAGLVLMWGIGGRLADAGAMAATLVVMTQGFLQTASGRASFKAWAVAWWVAGMLSVLVGLVQFALPGLTELWLVASNTTPGRAIGNMRQPNHLSTVLLCACAATAWLWQERKLSDLAGASSLAALVLGVALTASRTGGLSLGILLLWAVIDKTLPKRLRIALALTPVFYVLCWGAITVLSSLEHESFYGAKRLAASGDISSSRFAIWMNALTLIAQNPWTGVGWGNFNFAWTFTPFPGRPIAFFDHTHNVALQLIVEIGLPATLLATVALLWAAWRARGALAASNLQTGSVARSAFVTLLLLGVHSMLEYPLWYAYFLLPAGWALGVYLGSAPSSQRPASHSQDVPSGRRLSVALQAFGVLMILGSLYAAWDHRRVEVIFNPPANAGPLDARIAQGRRSILFGHHADYAAVTVDAGDTNLPSFRRPLHQLVDVRLLIAYIEALKAHGEDDKALYAAQRLREFHRPDAQEYFEECTPDHPAHPFQCETRPVPLTWRDMDPR